jgi:hypothetical protein
MRKHDAPERSDAFVSARILVVSGGVLAAVAVSAIVFHGWYALASEDYLQFTGGVWLALARDLADGLFYRPVMSGVGYGGTRYFPLFFSLIGLLMRTGLSPLAAAHAVSLFSAALLFGGVVRVSGRLGVPRLSALLLGLLALAPHYVQQTTLGIRSDILAAALIVWGVSFAMERVGPDSRTGQSPWIAATAFTLALATKPTAAYGAAAALAALVLNGRWQPARRLLAWSAVGVLLFFVAVQVASGGRALESFRACALAGDSPVNLIRNLFQVRMGPVGGLRFLTVVLGVAALAWLFDLRRNWNAVPSVLFCFAAITTAVILGSPGTVHPNQVTDIHVAAVIVIGAFLQRHDRVRRAGYAVVLLLLLLAGYQDYERAIRQNMAAEARGREATLRAFSRAVDGFRKPVLSESPEFPVIEGTRPYLLDAFTLRIVTITRPDVLADVLGKLHDRAFAYILLIEDPETTRGRGWYENVHFGWPIVEALLENYRYQETSAGMRIYVPKESGKAGEPTEADSTRGTSGQSAGHPR